jgi:alcohol dehydrogenase, propanol-preferring
MKAMMLERIAPIEQKPLRLADLPMPVPAEKEILIKVSACGVCHTELDEIEGRLTPSKIPIVLGHQVVGHVADKGRGVTRHKTGGRVGVTWLYSSCGTCKFCLRGNENLCEAAKWTGKDADGGYAEYMTVGEDFAHPIPERFSDTQAAPLLCAGVIGYRTLRLADIQKGDIVGIFGFGASAHIVIQILKFKFPDNPVFVFTRDVQHQEFAKTFGAAWTGFSGDQPPQRIDKIMDFTSSGEVIKQALAVMNKGGRLVINAIRKTTPIPELDYAKYLWEERQIQSVANVTRQDAEEFLPLAAQIPITPTVQEFELSQANEALILLNQSKIHGAAVLKIASGG